MSNPNVGNYLNRHFVSAFQKVATFQINGGAKQGGNVASYFCTPEGQVLHAVAGPLDADTFLREARWANEAYQLARLNSPAADRMKEFFRKAHLARLHGEHELLLQDRWLPRHTPQGVTGLTLARYLSQAERLRLNNQGKVHLLLAVSPLSPLSEAYPVVFEKVLNEKITTRPVVVAGR